MTGNYWIARKHCRISVTTSNSAHNEDPLPRFKKGGRKLRRQTDAGSFISSV